jgi:hypothetical protein
MATPDEIEDAISENATGPKSVTVDGQSVNQHDLSDQLDALDRLQEKASARRATMPVRIAKIRPGGSI